MSTIIKDATAIRHMTLTVGQNDLYSIKMPTGANSKPFIYINNTGDHDIYCSNYSDMAEGSDDVLKIPVAEKRLYISKQGKIFIYGEGSCEVDISETSLNFNSASAGDYARAVAEGYTGTPEQFYTALAGISETNQQISELEEQNGVDKCIKRNTVTDVPLVTFVDDDGKSSTYDILYQIFAAKEEHFVSAVSADKIGTTGYMSKAQILEIKAAGNEIASHGKQHGSLVVLPEEIKSSYDSLNAEGFEVENLVYPGGYFDDDVIRESKKYYDCATAVNLGINLSPIRTFALYRIPIGKANNTTIYGTLLDGSLNSYKAMVDYAVANNGWLISMTHSFYSEFDATQQQHMSDLIDYIKSLNVSIVTLKEGMAIKRNAIDVGDLGTTDFVVGNEGSIRSTYMTANYTKNSALVITPTAAKNPVVNASTVAPGFPTGKITYYYYDIISASGFPSVAGVLEVNAIFSPYVHQIWYPYSDLEKSYYRKWNKDTSAWGAWAVIGQAIISSETVSVAGSTINANTMTQIIPTLVSTGWDFHTNAVVASPYCGLEPGIVWTTDIGSDNRIRLKLYNVTGSNITIATRNWTFKVFD